MTYTSSTRLDSTPQGGWAQETVWNAAIARGAKRQGALAQYLDAVYGQHFLNPEIVAIQSAHETGWWASDWWANRLNPAGIGITGTPAQDNASRDFENGINAARAHLAHLALYHYGTTLPEGFPAGRSDDPRWDAAIAAGYAGTVQTIGGLTGTWAADPRYAAKLTSTLNEKEAMAPQPGDGTGGAVPGGEPMAGYTKHTWPGLDVPVYLPDWIKVEVKIIPSSVSGWTSGTKSSRHVKTTWHDTGNPSSTANSEYTWARGGGRGAMNSPGSYNGIYDGGKLIITQRFDEMVGHAANNTGNYTSYAFEQAFGSGGGGFEASMKVGAFVHGGLIAAKGWDVDTALVQHWNWSRKNCPGQIRNKGLWAQAVSMTKDAAIKAKVAATGGTIPVPKPEPEPDIDFPTGMNLEIAEALFGRVEGDDKVMYSFDPTGKGVISRKWLEIGKTEKKFPTLQAVRIFGDARYFAFSNGTVLWHAKVTDPVAVLGA